MKLILAAIAFTLAATAQANPQDLQLVGKARLDVMFWSIYDSRLLAPQGKYQPGVRPLRLEITYLRNIDAEDLVKRTREEWEHLGLAHPEQEDWLSRLGVLWPDIRKQDTLSLHLEQDNSSAFYLNGELLGEVEDADFGQQFLDIWLSPQTSRPELRSALLGNSG